MRLMKDLAETEPVLIEMGELVQRWQAKADQRAVFLSCYRLMTANMLDAVARQEFKDNAWTSRFINRFADYYFIALSAYNQCATEAPRVWQVAHDSCRYADIWPLQGLLLGINAHINYDLVLTLEEMLRPEWPALTTAQRATRLADYLYVNEIIYRTIDAVQDDVLEPGMPSMRLIDAAFGPTDEWMLSRLLQRWRGRVWKDALRLLSATESRTRDSMVGQVETLALRRAAAIRHPNRLTSLRAIL